MIDWQKVRALRDEVGEDGFAEVIDLFLEEVELRLGTLGNPTRDFADDMHFLKGCARNLGFSRLAQLCEAADPGRPADQASRAAEIDECYRASRMIFLSQIGAGLEAG